MFPRRRKKYPDLHKAVQNHILATLPPGEAFREYRLPGHIADVAWLEQKIIFEIQCSQIPLFRAIKRTKDYNNLGFTVVWILHQKAFNYKKINPLENFLRKGPCYYTDITKLGHGKIYDQFEAIEGRIRTFRSPPLTVNLNLPDFRGDRLQFQGDCQTNKVQNKHYQQIIARRKSPTPRFWWTNLYLYFLNKLVEYSAD